MPTNRFFLLIFLVWAFGLQAQSPYELNPKYPVHSLDGVLSVWKDSTEVLSPEILLEDPPMGAEQGDALPQYLDVRWPYWGKLTLLATDSLPGWRLHFEDKMIGPPAWTKSNGKVDVWAYARGELLFHKRSGVEYPKAVRDRAPHWVLNSVGLDGIPSRVPVTLVIRVEGNSIGYPPYFHLTARSPEQPFYHQIFQFNTSFNVFMFGAALIIFIYHLLQFLYMRERVILWFVLWLGFCTLTQAMTVGLLIGDISRFRLPVQIAISNGVFYTFWFFGRAYVGSRQKFPVLDRFIKGLALLTLAEIITVVAYVIVFDPQAYFTAVGWHYPFLLVYTLGSLGLAIALVLKRDAFARYFGIGTLVGGLGLLVGIFWSMGLINLRFLGVDPYATGIFLQLLIYSLGIAYRRQTLAKQAAEERVRAAVSESEVRRISDLNALKSRFFTNISHEFRTPLTLIRGPIQAALDRSGKEGGSEVRLPSRDLDMVRRNTERLEGLVDELLELSRIESGKAEILLTHGDVEQVLKSVVFAFESLAERNNIALRVDLGDAGVGGSANAEQDVGADPIWYDRNKLEKIIYNLLSNAFKYTPDGGSVSFSSGIKSGRLRLEISDTGKGIPAADLEQIFERFYRVEGDEAHGSGIGLALCKELVELQGGELSVESTPGKGTSFSVCLPTRPEDFPKPNRLEQDAAPDLPAAGPLPAINRDVGQPKSGEQLKNASSLPRILLVEDNADLRQFVGEVLQENYRVLYAEDGLQGERMAIEHIPDVVVSDVMMPRKDGYELCHALKTNTKTSHIPIILLTARAGQENKMEGLFQGAEAYLTKPFEARELLVRIRNLMGRQKALWEKMQHSSLVLPGELDLPSLDDAFLKKVGSAIESHLDSAELSVEFLAQQVGFSRAQLHRKLKALTGKSPNQLINEVRLEKARLLLQSRSATVSEVAYSVGFSNLSYFTKRFRERYGMTPSAFIADTE